MIKKLIPDSELLGRDLIVSDAYDHDGLVCETLPDGITVREPLACYVHERYEHGEKVFCCACGIRKHKFGYWVTCSDDTVRPLGNCCAKPRLGRDWVRGEQALKDLRRRKEYLVKLQEACPVVLHARRGLSEWDCLGRELKQRQRAFFKALPEVYELIVQVAKRDGVLEATERVMNVHWDAKNPEDAPKWHYLPRNHFVLGRAFIRYTEPHEVTSAVERAIQKFVVAANHTDAHTTKQLQTVCADVERARRNLERLGEMAAAYSSFFSDQNLDGIVRWSQLLSGDHDRRLRRPIGRGARSLINYETGAAFELDRLLAPDSEVLRLLAI